MKTDKSKPTVHLILYRKMRKMSKGRRYIGHCDVMEIMKRFLPFFSHSLYYPIIEDLEKDSLIRKIDKTKYEIIGGNSDAPLNKYNCPV